MKKALRITAAAILVTALALGMSACSDNNEGQSKSGKVYYLNFKPEQDTAWQNLSKAYTDETGVAVTVVTAAENTYESTLTSEIDKTNAPTLFQVNGPVGLQSWKDYCYDLTDSALHRALTNEEFALRDDGKILGIAYAIETYGIIYNKTLLDKYFNSKYSSIKSVDEIDGFDSLSKCVTEIQKHKDDLGIDGAFTSAGMDASSDWRFKTHLANIPIYYEYRDEGISSTEAIKGTYLDNYKKIWDLYINNSTVDKSQLATKTGDDASAEFSTAKAVFYQNGTWAVGDVTGAGKLKEDELGMLPIYIGVDGEEKQGLTTGSENYWCVNKNAPQEDIDATLAFLEWLITSEKGKTALAEDMGFVTPFESGAQSANPLVKIANEYIENGKTPVTWNFATIPSEGWKDGVGSALTAYAQGNGTWDSVKTAFVDGWKTEYNKAHQ